MSQVLCVHCQQPIEAGAPRRGNLVTCTSCKGQVYVPQVQHVATYAEKQAAARAATTARQKATPQRGYKPSGKRGSTVASNGFSVTLIILTILLVGGALLGIGGFFAFKAIKGHMDARKQLATTKYDFERSSLPPPVAEPQVRGATGGVTASTPGSFDLPSTDAAKPTLEDLQKLQKFFEGLEETSARLTKDYLKDLDKTGINQLLVANRIAADKDFSQSRQIIAAAREVIARHREIAEFEDEAFLKDMARIKFEGVPTEVMVGRVRAMTQEAQPEMDKIRAMDVAITTQYEGAIKHLEATRGSWKLEGESVVFSENKHAERYKTFFDEVDKCAQTKLDLWQKIGQDSIPKWKAAFGLMN